MYAFYTRTAPVAAVASVAGRASGWCCSLYFLLLHGAQQHPLLSHVTIIVGNVVSVIAVADSVLLGGRKLFGRLQAIDLWLRAALPLSFLFLSVSQ